MVADPADHIDRHREQTLFDELVKADPTGRILTICDSAQNGKSSLLKCLQHRSHWELDVPATLVELDKLTGHNLNAFAMVEKIVDGFWDEQFRAEFTGFERIRHALQEGDRSIFDKAGPAHLEGRALVGRMSGGQAIGVYQHTEHHYHGPEAGPSAETPTFKPYEEDKARELAVAAFFDDLRRICATRRVVILLDAWDRCNVDLRNWVYNVMFGKHVLSRNPDERPALLRTVITARPHHPVHEKHGLRVHEFRPMFRDEKEYRDTVRSISGLSEWDDEHIRDFLTRIGNPDVAQAYVDVIGLQLRQEHKPLGWVLTVIQPLVQPRSA